jgi:hypothetical protein
MYSKIYLSSFCIISVKLFKEQWTKSESEENRNIIATNILTIL